MARSVIINNYHHIIMVASSFPFPYNSLAPLSSAEHFHPPLPFPSFRRRPFQVQNTFILLSLSLHVAANHRSRFSFPVRRKTAASSFPCPSSQSLTEALWSLFLLFLTSCSPFASASLAASSCLLCPLSLALLLLRRLSLRQDFVLLLP